MPFILTKHFPTKNFSQPSHEEKLDLSGGQGEVQCSLNLQFQCFIAVHGKEAIKVSEILILPLYNLSFGNNYFFVH